VELRDSARGAYPNVVDLHVLGGRVINYVLERGALKGEDGDFFWMCCGDRLFLVEEVGWNNQLTCAAFR
jgi:hypothetical protein